MHEPIVFRALPTEHPAYDAKKMVDEQSPEELFRYFIFVTQHQAKPDALVDRHIRSLIDQGLWHEKITNGEYLLNRLDEPGISTPPETLNCLKGGTIICAEGHGCIVRELDSLLKGKTALQSVLPLRFALRLKERVGAVDPAAGVRAIIGNKTLSRKARSGEIFRLFRVIGAAGTVGLSLSGLLHPVIDPELTISEWVSKVDPHALTLVKGVEIHNRRLLKNLLGRELTDQEREAIWKKIAEACGRTRKRWKAFLDQRHQVTGVGPGEASKHLASPRVINYLMYIFDNGKERYALQTAERIQDCFAVEDVEPVCEYGLDKLCPMRAADICRRFNSQSFTFSKKN